MTATSVLTVDGSGVGASAHLQILGGAGDDFLTGGAGNDILFGGLGSDTLKGGCGADHFRYDAPADGAATVAGADHIVDFSVGEGDLFDIKAAGFEGVTIGQEAIQVRVGSGGFTSADQRFNFDTDTHTLNYDSNGSAAGGVTAVLAVLDNAVNVTNAQLHFS